MPPQKAHNWGAAACVVASALAASIALTSGFTGTAPQMLVTVSSPVHNIRAAAPWQTSTQLRSPSRPQPLATAMNGAMHTTALQTSGISSWRGMELHSRSRTIDEEHTKPALPPIAALLAASSLLFGSFMSFIKAVESSTESESGEHVRSLWSKISIAGCILATTVLMGPAPAHAAAAAMPAVVKASYLQQMAAFLAPIFTIGMFAAPLEVFTAVVKNRSIGNFPLLPYLTMQGNCWLWLRYGLQMGDLTIVMPNTLGLSLSTLTIGSFCFFSNKQQKPAVVKQAVVVLSILLVSFFFGPSSLSSQGLMASTVSVLLYASPLAELGVVIKNKDSSSLPSTQILFGALCAFWWAVYGFCTANPYVLIPNGIGAVLCLIQLYFCNKYKKSAALE